jgi:integrase
MTRDDVKTRDFVNAQLVCERRCRRVQARTASLAIRSRASIKTVQRLLGHATAVMRLDQYGHLYPDELDQVAEQMGADCVYGR